ncbi:hypothetical protein JZ751_005739, partial [Albula glossodonta]
YSTPVVKYDRNGFRPRLRLLVLTHAALYVGDLVLQCDHLFEALTKLSMLTNKHSCIRVVQGSIKFDIQPGREGFVDFSSGQESMVYRTKNGHLMV